MNTSKTNTDTKGNRKGAAPQEKPIPEEKHDTGLMERSKYSLDLINTWITSADSKISTSCGIVSVVVAVLVFVAENILSKIDRTNGAIEPWKTWFIITSTGAMITFILSLFLGLFISVSLYERKLHANPTALDVYRDKTILNINIT